MGRKCSCGMRFWSQPPARGKCFKSLVSKVGGFSHNLTKMPQGPGGVHFFIFFINNLFMYLSFS